VNEERYYSGIKQLRECRSVSEANELLAQGYEVLRIAELGNLDLAAKQATSSLVYILGMREREQVQKRTASSSNGAAILERIKNLPFKIAPFDSSGKTYGVGPNDSAPEIKEYIRNHGWKVEIEKFEYSLANSGWINRREKEKQK
jgi:hypothetical protein